MILSTVRGKMIANSAVILLVIAVATVYSGLATADLARSVELLFRDNRRMESIGALLDKVEASMSGYLATKSSDSLKDYIMYSTRLADEARGLSRGTVRDDLALLQKDLAGVIDSYLADAEAAVAAKRGRDAPAYTASFEGSERGAELARFLIERIDRIFVSRSLAGFTGFNERIPGVLASSAALVVAATLTALMLLVRYSYKLTDPISRLAEAARAVGRGVYDTELPVPSSGDEIATTTAAFASMQESVRRAFEEALATAEIERRLMEERMRVLELDHKLKDAELLALQTQINPHFLFNTLSAGMQVAMAEGSDRTADFLDKLASFIRYALKPPSRSVRVADEIECIERYVWLLELRFGDRYRFALSIDEAALGVETPALVLQPIVENAVAHGLRDREDGGEVRITVRMEGGEAVMEVRDTGDGMAPEELARITRESAEDEAVHEGGIGLRNVMRRVSLATGGEGRVEVESSPGAGTSVRVRLPARGPA